MVRKEIFIPIAANMTVVNAFYLTRTGIRSFRHKYWVKCILSDISEDKICNYCNKIQLKRLITSI